MKQRKLWTQCPLFSEKKLRREQINNHKTLTESAFSSTLLILKGAVVQLTVFVASDA